MDVQAGLVSNVANEVLHGFGPTEDETKHFDFHRSTLQDLIAVANENGFDQLIPLHSLQEKAFLWALKLTLTELGEDEFQTRTGFGFDEGKRTLQASLVEE